MADTTPSDVAARSFRLGRVLLVALIGIGVLLLIAREAASFYIEVLWFQATGYEAVFWKRTLWEWGVRVFIAGLAALLVLANLRVVTATLGSIQIKRRFGNLEISEQLPRSYVVWGMAAASILMGLWFGAAVPSDSGLRALLLFQAPEWGITEPILGRDLSFYAFVLPLLTAGTSLLLVLVFLLAALSAAGYAATGSLSWTGKSLEMGDVPRLHLATLAAVFLVLLGVRFWVSRYVLLLDGSSSVQGIFGFADAQARLPAFQTMAAISVVSAGAVVWGGLRKRKVPAVAGLVAVAVGAIVLGQIYPGLVQRFRVEPNELARETPYIEHNLEFTRLGFGLDRLQERPFDYSPAAGVDWEQARAQFDGLPVWPASALLTTYRELEARFRYYDFASVAIDRYRGPTGPEPIALSVREVDPRGIEDPNWQNLHIRRRYMAGAGAVASSADGQTPEGRPPMYLSAIPPEFAGEDAPGALALEQADVYIGSRPQNYSIINPQVEEFLRADGSPAEPGVDFPAGIELSSPVRTLSLAWRFRDANLLFASEVSDQSRFVFRRHVAGRVSEIAPFLIYPADPYPVIHDGRVKWILDGYTTTRHFPLSSAQEVQRRRRVSYIRNSVKAVVDGMTGAVDLYIVEPDDRLIQAYDRAFPGLFQELEAMPASLQEHLRYPRELLTLQAQVLFQYHQETAAEFHGQQDVWAPAQELAQGTSPVAYQPEYGIYTLPDETEPEFLLTTVFVPAGRQNLTGLLVARSDGRHYGELLLYDIPVEDQAPGPRQVEALVEQDPVISQQFSLWRQGGSRVWSAHLHLVPVGNTLLYMEAIFLAAEEDAIPELRRFVVSDGRRVSMQPTLAGAVAALAEGDEEVAPAEDAPGRATPSDAAVASDPGQWPQEALDLLDEAESRLRAGDYQGFGEALERLRTLLRELARSQGG